MKKLFTLVALLAIFLGAKAGKVTTDKTVDYTTYTGFPFYVMGYVPEFYGDGMTDLGGGYKYVKVTDGAEETSDVTVKTQDGTDYYRIEVSDGTWHQYFIATGIPTEVGGSYTVTALVKASKACSVPINMRWSWDFDPVVASANIPQSDDFVEVTWEFSGIDGSSCDLIAQPNTDAEIVWKSLVVTHEEDEGTVAQTWLQMLTNDGQALDEEGHTNTYMGNAEFGQWPAWALMETDNINANWRGDRTGEICAWALTMGRNFDDQNTTIKEDSPRSRPYPADIEAEEGNTSNHVFAVHVDQVAAIDAAASIAWSNQFWIQSPQEWKAGTKVKLHFRYKADRAQRTETQIHKIHPSDYLYWQAVGDVNFTTEWQEFDKTIEFSTDQAGGTSLAFNLTPDAAPTSDTDATPKDAASLEPNVFYFDDLSWEVLKLDHGFFVAGKGASVAYDYSQAVQFTEEDEDYYTVTIGTEGNKDSWVNEIQISTVRGDKSAFLGATLKVGTITLNKKGVSEWLDYSESSQAKIKLPAAGVYDIELDSDAKQMRFTQVEGDTPKELVDIVTNPEVLVVNAVERDYLAEGEAEAGTGATWDNQFFIYPNRVLEPGEETVLEFDFLATTKAVAKVAYQGIVVEDDTEKQNDYVTGAFNLEGDNIFNSTEKHFKGELTMPNKKWNGSTCNGVQFLSFDLACIKEANAYTIKNVKWYLKNETEGKTTLNLINATGTDNFKVKIGAGNPIVDYGTDGISTVVSKKNAGSAVIYNLAGQRVSNSFKGIVVKDGKKVVIK